MGEAVMRCEGIFVRMIYAFGSDPLPVLEIWAVYA